jgi:Alkylmercury lyase
VTVPIKTGAALRELGLPASLAARRDARQDETLHTVWQAFLERGGPIAIDEIVRALPERAPADVRASLTALDGDDLLVLAAEHVELAYPFATGPNAFAVDVAGVTRYACCATDVLGLAPMLDERITVRTSCHHCGEPFAIDVDPDGARSLPQTMVWVAPRDACGARLASGL